MLRWFTLSLALCISCPALAHSPGDKVSSFSLSDSSGKGYTLGSFKKKVLMVWYEGAKSKEQNRWLKDKLKKTYDTNQIHSSLWESVGIANFQEHWAPNSLINSLIRSETKKTGSLILCDKTGGMMKQWGFRNGRSNIYMLDKGRVLRWKSSGPLTEKRGEQLIRLLRRLTKE
ncbi:MAG: YtfJ family protein [Polyangia bacterium]|jgi:predicted transcriptional regulator|nr:YtfJ family protein [Polyangia bacterium]